MDKETLMQAIGANVRYYRTRLGMTQEVLAEKAGISTSFCANIERGNKAISILVLCALANVLGVTPNHLFYGGAEDHRLDNLMFFLQDKSDDYLACLEAALRAIDDRFVKVAR